MSERVQTRAGKHEIVLLHGWGMRASVWNEAAADLAQHSAVHALDLPGYGDARACEPYTLDGMSDTLAAAAPPRVTLCGWSLGGQVALTWALRYPQQVERVVLIATTPRFVADDEWPYGMDRAVFEGFETEFSKDAGGVLQRFLTLQVRGDSDARSLLRVLREHVVQPEGCEPVLRAGLRLLADPLLDVMPAPTGIQRDFNRLSSRPGPTASPGQAFTRGNDESEISPGRTGQTDLRSQLRNIVQPALIVHGDGDAVVPIGTARYLQRELPQAALEVVSGAGHVPFVSRPQQVARRIVDFCNGG